MMCYAHFRFQQQCELGVEASLVGHGRVAGTPAAVGYIDHVSETNQLVWRHNNVTAPQITENLTIY